MHFNGHSSSPFFGVASARRKGESVVVCLPERRSFRVLKVKIACSGHLTTAEEGLIFSRVGLYKADVCTERHGTWSSRLALYIRDIDVAKPAVDQRVLYSLSHTRVCNSSIYALRVWIIC